VLIQEQEALLCPTKNGTLAFHQLALTELHWFLNGLQNAGSCTPGANRI
jgi:hypothetical protein